MSRDESRHRQLEGGRPPVPPRPSSLRNTTVRLRPRRYSNTMDGYDPTTGLPSQGAPPEAQISSNYQGQESLLTEFQVKVVQDMAGIQHGLNCLTQQVAAVPSQVLEGMARAGAPEESGWFSRISRLHQQLHHQHDQAPPPAASAARLAELQGESKVLSSRNKELQRELDGARRELETVRRKIGGMEGQLRESQEEVNKLRGKEAMLRSMILDQASVQEVSDDDIFQGFMNLRQNVQKISRSTAYAVDTNPLLSAAQEEAMPHLKDFYSPASWGVLALPDRWLRLRAKIYDELHHRILDYNHFGLFGIHAWDGVNNGLIEPGLRRFEYLLKERGVSDNLISDWRISTIKCVELSGIEDLNCTSASNSIYAILAPLLSKHTRPSDEDTLRAGILELCKDAFKLRMLMRKSKNRYLVKTIDPGMTVLLSACENTAYSVSVEGGNNSEKSDEIAYVVFGALVKQPQTADQPEKVLEKAHVVLKRKVTGAARGGL
ncbi:hypothetical protein C8A01DRAFT_18927 [Parachaetomium inaequale]|uniref:Uncharacterized protein n=1 Tax=Parachaetomium inaequale TaxID=2588326 RepID=A0AAN6P9L9_9PEZI|nr:hypothetical protein C8A01DRAFT_18927 [Parachaetomium inaequale]